MTAEGQELASGGSPRPAVSERVRQKERTRAALITAARRLILDGDRITMMGAAIVAMALIPSYKAIGIAAPILVVTARMVQGFSLGGEVGPTTAFLLESAPLNRRGLAVSWHGAHAGGCSGDASRGDRIR